MKFNLSKSDWEKIGSNNGWMTKTASAQEFEVTFSGVTIGDFPDYEFSGVAMISYEDPSDFKVMVAAGNIVAKKKGIIVSKKEITEGMVFNLQNKIKNSQRIRDAVNRHSSSKKAGMNMIQIKTSDGEV
jgi:L-aminopeptidase/D-esterase-like protein